MSAPIGITEFSGAILIATQDDNRIRAVIGGSIGTPAGNGGYAGVLPRRPRGDGPSSAPTALVWDSAHDALFFGDDVDMRIGRVEGDRVRSAIGDGVARDTNTLLVRRVGDPRARDLRRSSLRGRCVEQPNVGARSRQHLHLIDLRGDRRPGLSRLLDTDRGAFASVGGIAGDSAGNVYATDPPNGRVRKIAPNGTVTTIAGTGTPAVSGNDGSHAADAQYGGPTLVIEIRWEIRLCPTVSVCARSRSGASSRPWTNTPLPMASPPTPTATCTSPTRGRGP